MSLFYIQKTKYLKWKTEKEKFEKFKNSIVKNDPIALDVTFFNNI